MKRLEEDTYCCCEGIAPTFLFYLVFFSDFKTRMTDTNIYFLGQCCDTTWKNREREDRKTSDAFYNKVTSIHAHILNTSFSLSAPYCSKYIQ